MKYLYLLLLSLGFLGCRTLDRASSHLAGSGGEVCDETETAAEFRPLLKYLRTQLSILVEANPATLGGREFCFQISGDNELEIRSTHTGALFFAVGLLKATETDAQFAALLSHELAHIVKKHETMDLKEFVDLHPAYQNPYLELTMEQQEITRYDILHVVPEREWTEYLDHLRALTLQKWSAHKRNKNTLAKGGVACAAIKTWEKISEARKAVVQKLPTADYEQNLCEQFFQEFNVQEKFAELLESGKEKEADQLGIELFLNAAYPEDEYSQFFANVVHLGGGQASCQTGEGKGDCFRTQNIRSELKEYVKALGHPKPIKIYGYPVSLADLKRQFENK